MPTDTTPPPDPAPQSEREADCPATTCSRPLRTRQTFAYSLDYSNGHLAAFPEIDGMKCTAWSASDLFEELEVAQRALAKIAVGYQSCTEAADIAQAFFDQINENPYSYHDPDEDDDENDQCPPAQTR